jgi:glycosyltransferase involved in cell wall biosynthesis
VLKLTILTFARYYLPGYMAGGPIRSIANMVDRLGDQFDFRIFTTDRDVGDSKPYPTVPRDRWTNVGKAAVFYASREARSIARIARLMRQTSHDVLYVNSFFDPTFTLRPLLARRLRLAPIRPLVIAPRGEFSPGALHIKWWKKTPYVAVMRGLRLYRPAIWHASSELEAADIKRVMNIAESARHNQRLAVAADIVQAMPARKSEHQSSKVLIAPNVSGSIHAAARPKGSMSNAQGSVDVCFLSRITHMKNLDYALRVLAEVRAHVRFSIYGPQELPAYWAECSRLMQALPQNVEATYCGTVEHANVLPTLAEYDLLFLPSRGENFGHVIHEALQAGTPVLTSDQTPWRDLERHGVGWALPLNDPRAFGRAIEAAATWDAEKRESISRAARAYGERVGSDGAATEANYTLFVRALSQRVDDHDSAQSPS